MKKIIMLFIAVAVLGSGGWFANDRVQFDRAEWLSDYEQLRSAVETHYANLKWSRASKNVDLVALNQTALEQLQRATSRSAARAALNNFVAGFNDAHFHIERKPPHVLAAIIGGSDDDDGAPPIDFGMTPANVCSTLGFSTKSHELSVEGATPAANSTFVAGTLATHSGRKFGIIRIPLFQQREYGEICEKSWPQFQNGKSGACDEICQDDFSVLVKHEVAQALADDARALVSAGAEAVVIDLTGNGGGTEWAEFAANALSAKPLRQPAVALIRAISDSASVSCDLSALWKNQHAHPDCWNIVPAHSDPHEDAGYARPYNGALYIMTDPATASASEQFAATLQDNGVARTIGQATMGIGCGFVNGGNPVTLRHSGLVVWMPNCVRFRADGRNEFEGVKPDYPVDWGDDQASKTAALLEVLDKLPRATP